MNRLNTVFLRRLVPLLMLVCMGFWTLPASAGGLSPKGQKQIIAVVQAQLDAFAQDDAEKAFSYAAPNIRHRMGNAENFIEMVRARYEIVYRPHSTSFMQPIGNASAAMLMVRMTDAGGDAWIATYTLLRQKDKTWRIAACVLTESTGYLV